MLEINGHKRRVRTCMGCMFNTQKSMQVNKLETFHLEPMDIERLFGLLSLTIITSCNDIVNVVLLLKCNAKKDRRYK